MKSQHHGAWMWGQALQLLEDAERLQRRFFYPPQGARGRWEPPVDVVQRGDELWIFLAVPGVPQERVDVLIDGTTLVVRGDRPLPQPVQGAVIHRLEIPYGPFERRIALPAGRYQLLQKAFDHGCLVLGVRSCG